MKTYLALFLAATSGCLSSEPTCEVGGVAAWRELPTSDAPRAQSHFVAAWTGTELIVWGGKTEFFADNRDSALATGARFDPSTATWTPMSTVGAPAGRRRASAVWTGSELIVWGGEDDDGYFADGARYNPALDRWTPISAAGAPSARTDAFAVWTGSEVLVSGGFWERYSLRLHDGALYNPATDTWRPIELSRQPDDDFMRASEGARATWTGQEVVFWGSHFDSAGQQGYDRGWIYNPAAQTWRMMSRTGEPSVRSPEVLTMHDGKVLMWGGNELYRDRSDGALYDVATDTWHALPSVPLSSNRTALAADGRVIVSPDNDGNGWVVDPLTGATFALPSGPSAGNWAPIAWTGSEAIAWMQFAEPREHKLGGRLTLCQ